MTTQNPAHILIVDDDSNHLKTLQPLSGAGATRSPWSMMAPRRLKVSRNGRSP